MNTLYVTYCSGAKHGIEGSPEELYDSQRITGFIQRCKGKQYDWAILSAKYGLFFPEERHDNYNTTFKTVAYRCRVIEGSVTLSAEASKLRIQKLAQQVKRRLAERDVKRLIFFFEQPLQRRKCYLMVLHQAIDGCTLEHSTFSELKQHLNYRTDKGLCSIELSDNMNF